MGEQISITMQDGFELGAYHSAPSGQSKGVVVVIQEIFGVNGHIREVVEGYGSGDIKRLRRLFLTASDPIFSWVIPKLTWARA